MIQECIDRFKMLTELEPGWDGYGASVPTEYSVRMAKAFVESIPEDMQCHIFIAPLPDGRVEIEAEFPSKLELVIDFPPTEYDNPTTVLIDFVKE